MHFLLFEFVRFFPLWGRQVLVADSPTHIASRDAGARDLRDYIGGD
jgi:hypothetical protein